jgi:hypothetical protein
MLHREPLMNTAPGRDLVPDLVRSPSLEGLRSFYHMRVGWRCYPIIHERMMSSSLFDDFYAELKKQPAAISNCLDYALTILEEEDEKYILCAVFLLSCVCNCLPKERAPSAEQLQRIVQLHPRVKNYAFIINLASFWEEIAAFAGRFDAALEKELFFHATSSPELPELRLRKSGTALPCSVSMEVIEEWMETFAGNYAMELRGAMEIRDDRYWVFQCHQANTDIATDYSEEHLWVHRDANSTNQLFRKKIHAAGDETLRKEIISYHFAPWEHAAY